MNSKIILIYLGIVSAGIFFCFTDESSEAKAQGITLKLSSEVSETVVLMPVELDFRLMNFSGKTVRDIPLLEPEGDDKGMRLHVTFKGTKKELKHPVLNLIREDVYPPPSLSFELKPGQTENCLITLGTDWFFEKPVFSEPGLYTISGSHIIPGTGRLESNSISISVRGAVTESEAEAVRILGETKVLSCFYHPALLYESGISDTGHIAQAVRKLYELNPPTPYRNHARTALLKWRDSEIKYRKGNYPGARKAGLDNLGLTDLNLDEK